MKKTIRILVVEDNKIFAELLCEYLSKRPEFEIAGVAYNGLDACKMIDENVLDVILLDIIMPDMNGMDVLAKINTKEQSRPAVIIVTAIGNDSVIQRMLDMGALYYLRKPIEMEALAQTILSLYNEPWAKSF